MQQRNIFRFQPQLKADIEDLAEEPRLWVREIPVNLLMSRWATLHVHEASLLKPSITYFVECDKRGKIDWVKANVYTPIQLIGRNNVKVVKI